jgi:hypothetical protein
MIEFVVGKLMSLPLLHCALYLGCSLLPRSSKHSSFLFYRIFPGSPASLPESVWLAVTKHWADHLEQGTLTFWCPEDCVWSILLLPGHSTVVSP